MVRLSDISKGESRELDRVLEAKGLDGDLARAIIRNGMIAKIMVDAGRAYLGAEARKAETFENEQVASTYAYPSGWKMKSVREQATILAAKFPSLDVSHVDEIVARFYTAPSVVDATEGDYHTAPKSNGTKIVLPKNMDGLAVILKPSAAARKNNQELPDWPVYNLAMNELLNVVAASDKKFVDYTERNVGPKRLRLTQKTEEVYAKLEALMPGDVMIVPVQTGLLHRGKSVQRARVTFEEQEFGLCAFAVGCILLTHPERLKHVDHLWIDCAGSEFAPDSGEVFTCFPCWGFNGSKLGFRWSRVSFFSPDCGSASGVSPECPLAP